MSVLDVKAFSLSLWLVYLPKLAPRQQQQFQHSHHILVSLLMLDEVYHQPFPNKRKLLGN